jgi:hypothetical protein
VPVLYTEKKTGKDGSITINAVIKHSALNKSESFAPTAKPSRGWPPEAVADWKTWGHREPMRFFAKWPELASGNAAPGGLNR